MTKSRFNLPATVGPKTVAVGLRGVLRKSMKKDVNTFVDRETLTVDSRQLETKNATVQDECLFRVQIPSDDVPRVLNAIAKATSLRYGNYERVSFRCCQGMQQYKPLAGSKTGEAELVNILSDEISFTVPRHAKTITAVIDALFESHPYEEPVILIQDVMSTRFKYPTNTN